MTSASSVSGPSPRTEKEQRPLSTGYGPSSFPHAQVSDQNGRSKREHEGKMWGTLADYLGATLQALLE